MKGHFSIFGALDLLIGAGGVSQTKSYDEQNQALLVSTPGLVYCYHIQTMSQFCTLNRLTKGLLSLTASFAITSATAAGRTPNFVLIFMDDQG